MRCPKCQKEAFSDKECDYCGVVFEKYQKLLEKPTEQEIQKNGSNIKKPITSLSALLKIAIFVSIILGYVCLRVLLKGLCNLMHINPEYSYQAALVFVLVFYITGKAVVNRNQIKK